MHVHGLAEEKRDVSWLPICACKNNQLRTIDNAVRRNLTRQFECLSSKAKDAEMQFVKGTVAAFGRYILHFTKLTLR